MKFDMKNLSEDYIILKGDALKELIKKCQIKCENNLAKVSEETNINYTKLRKFTCIKNRRNNILVSDLRKILDFLNKTCKDIDHYKIVSSKISSMGRNGMILEPKFPIDFSRSEAISVMADILTDGAFCRPRNTVEYMNTNLAEIITNIKNMNIIFCNHYII